GVRTDSTIRATVVCGAASAPRRIVSRVSRVVAVAARSAHRDRAAISSRAAGRRASIADTARGSLVHGACPERGRSQDGASEPSHQVVLDKWKRIVAHSTPDRASRFVLYDRYTFRPSPPRARETFRILRRTPAPGRS